MKKIKNYGPEESGSKPKDRGSEVAPKRWTDEVTFREKIMKHLKSQRRHSKAFRKEAVELLLTGRTLGELGEQLQVPVATLHNWKQEYLMDLEHQAPDVAGLPPLKIEVWRPNPSKSDQIRP